MGRRGGSPTAGIPGELLRPSVNFTHNGVFLTLNDACERDEVRRIGEPTVGPYEISSYLLVVYCDMIEK